VINTDSQGIAKCIIGGPVADVIVSRHGYDSKEKQLQLADTAGGYQKIAIQLNLPVNFGIIVQDPSTCEPLKNVFVTYSSGKVTGDAVTDKKGLALVRAENGLTLTAEAHLPGHVVGALKLSNKSKNMATPVLSLPQKLKNGETLRAVINWNKGACGVDRVYLWFNGNVEEKDCDTNPASKMLTWKRLDSLEADLNLLSVSFFGDSRSLSACISRTEIRLALYDDKGNSETISFLDSDHAIPKETTMIAGEFRWRVGCLKNGDLQSFVPINKFVLLPASPTDICKQFSQLND